MIDKKALILTTVLINLSVIGQSSNANIIEDFYIGSKIELIKDINLTLGYRLLDHKNFLRNSRFEQSFSQINSMSNNVSYERISMMSNFIYDLKKENGINSYIGFGAGITSLSDDFAQGDEALNTTYKITTGFSYKPISNKKLRFDMGYNYINNMSNNNISHSNKRQNRDFEGNGHFFSSNIVIQF